MYRAALQNTRSNDQRDAVKCLKPNIWLSIFKRRPSNLWLSLPVVSFLISTWISLRHHKQNKPQIKSSILAPSHSQTSLSPPTFLWKAEFDSFQKKQLALERISLPLGGLLGWEGHILKTKWKSTARQKEEALKSSVAATVPQGKGEIAATVSINLGKRERDA